MTDDHDLTTSEGWFYFGDLSVGGRVWAQPITSRVCSCGWSKIENDPSRKAQWATVTEMETRDDPARDDPAR